MITIFLCGLSWVAATEDIDYVNRVSFSQDMRFETMDNVKCESGKLILAPNASTGSVVSAAIPTRIEFNAASLEWEAKEFSGTQIQVEIAALDSADSWSEWKTVQASGLDVCFDRLGVAYRYRITLTANLEGVSPYVKSLGVFYNKIKEEILFAQDRPWEREKRASVGKPSVVSRADWGARKPTSGYTSHNPAKITIHHTWRPTMSDYSGASSIRQIQNYHMDTNGWSDIGYHFLIGTFPNSGETKIYQGRPENVVGAHTGGANTNNVGVNVIGDYTTEKVHGASYKALISLLAWLCDHYNIHPDNIYGHCDMNSTACPGDNLYKLRAQIRQDVKNAIDGGGNTENGILTGVIYDGAQGTGVKISGAVVTLHTGQSMTTTESGLYKFTLPVGTYQIQVRKSGYQTASTSDTVVANETVWESVGLKK